MFEKRNNGLVKFQPSNQPLQHAVLMVRGDVRLSALECDAIATTDVTVSQYVVRINRRESFRRLHDSWQLCLNC